ncbi:unnamed protein product, partial [Amoebophrya sp. A25]
FPLLLADVEAGSNLDGVCGALEDRRPQLQDETKQDDAGDSLTPTSSVTAKDATDQHREANATTSSASSTTTGTAKRMPWAPRATKNKRQAEQEEREGMIYPIDAHWQATLRHIAGVGESVCDAIFPRQNNNKEQEILLRKTFLEDSSASTSSSSSSLSRTNERATPGNDGG